MKMQQDGGTENAIYTARGHALDAMAALVMLESIRCIDPISSVVSSAFEEIAREVSTNDEEISLQSSVEDLLQRALRLKDMPLGDYSLHGPADEMRTPKE
ncbi:hypothetical protein GXW82_23270 [Streptacidiphilus sp. 4-A2]|nr:hypothetical protein [Streptacidiphilus sp. 4-A2]